MKRLSVLRDRRFSQSAEVRQQSSFLVFQLAQEHFAIPLLAVQKVTTLGSVFGDPQHSGISLTLHDDQQLVVIDVGLRIFNHRSTQQQHLQQSQNAGTSLVPKFLLIVQNQRGELVGLPVDSKPKIQSFPDEAVNPLPASYQNQDSIQCVSSLMIQGQTQPIFILDPDLVVNAATVTASLGHTAMPPLEAVEQPSLESPAGLSPLPQADDSLFLWNDADLVMDPAESLPALASDEETIDWENLSVDHLASLGLGDPNPETSLSPDSAVSDLHEIVSPLDPAAVDTSHASLGDQNWQAAMEPEAGEIDWEKLPLDGFDAHALIDPFPPEDESLSDLPDAPIDWAAIPLDGLDGFDPFETEPFETELAIATPGASDPDLPSPDVMLTSTPQADGQQDDDVSDFGDPIDWATLPLDGLDQF